MMKTGRSVGVVALALIAAAVLFAGCGGGGDGGGGAATGTVSGTITYAANGSALGGVSVSVGGITTTTDAQGRFLVRNVPTGTRTIVGTADPSRALVIPPGVPLTVDVVAGQTTQLPPIQMIDEADAPPAPPS